MQWCFPKFCQLLSEKSFWNKKTFYHGELFEYMSFITFMFLNLVVTFLCWNELDLCNKKLVEIKLTQLQKLCSKLPGVLSSHILWVSLEFSIHFDSTLMSSKLLLTKFFYFFVFLRKIDECFGLFSLGYYNFYYYIFLVGRKCFKWKERIFHFEVWLGQGKRKLLEKCRKEIEVNVFRENESPKTMQRNINNAVIWRCLLNPFKCPVAR